MSFGTGGLQRNPFRFLITPLATIVTADTWFPLSDARVPAAFWDYVRSDGGDIRVTLQDGRTQVAREIVGFNSTTKVGSLFLKVNSGTAFYIYFGNRQFAEPLASSTYGKNSTWESALSLVMHGSDMADSTVNANNGTSSSPPSTVAGKMLSAMSFNGSTSKVNIGNGATLRLTGDMTVSCWAKFTDYTANQRMIIGKLGATYYPGPYDFAAQATSGIPILLRGNGTIGGYASRAATAAATAGVASHLATTMSGTTVAHYLDGAANGGGSLSTTVADDGRDCYVGFRPFDGVEIMKGTIEELRLYSRALAADEIAQHKANQDAPATFWNAVGSMEQV
jgi:hypothetical protein